MDIVKYAEKICNFTLSYWQKEFLRNAYDAIKNNKQFAYIPPRGNSKFSYVILQALAVIYVAQERGFIKDILKGEEDQQILSLCVNGKEVARIAEPEKNEIMRVVDKDTGEEYVLYAR